MVHRLPDDLRAAVDAFDPERRGLWYTTPFVTTDEPSRRPAGDRRPARVVPGARGQAAGRRRLGRRRRRAGAVPHRRPGRRRRPRRGDRRARDRAGSGVVRRRPRRLQRRRQLRAVAARRPRPGRGRGVLPAPVRPGAGAAVPGGRAVLDPRVRAAGRYGGAAAGRDRDAARPGGADDDLLRAGQHLGPAAGGPRGDARRRAARGRAPAARPRLPRRVRHRRRADCRRVPAHRAQHPDVGRRHDA